MENRYKTLHMLAFMAFLANGDNYATASLLADIAKDLHLQVSTAGLSVTSYMMAYGVFTLLFGPLSDRFGKANIINVAALGTALFSMIGAFAFNLTSLVLFRAMNGLFGAGIIPVTIALTGELFDKGERQKALGTVMGMAFLGAATASAIGGALAYLGSWRLVYFIYGVGEVIIAILMVKKLNRDEPRTNTFNFFTPYMSAMKDIRFMRIVFLLFFIGFAVLGSFTYVGILLKDSTTLNTMEIGLVLSLFGVGTVFGGKTASFIRKKMKRTFLPSAGVLGFLSFFSLATFDTLLIQSFSIFGFGIAFMLLQSTLITTAQEKLPTMKGTAMSLASFFMFLGGAAGTITGGLLITSREIHTIYLNASILMFISSCIAAYFVSAFERRKLVIQKAKSVV